MISVGQPFIGFRERHAVMRVLRSRHLSQGPEVLNFEIEFSKELLDGRPVVAVNSGTSGQHLGLIAAGVSSGDEVIVPSFTFAASPNSVALAGGRPVFCDIDPVTFNLDVEHLKALITPKTRGIMPVHLFGHPADMSAIMEIARTYGLQVYEDAAQAHGASIHGQKVGTFGDFAMFSLYPTKNMTSGEGGMVACRSHQTARTVKLLRNQGMETRYHNEVVGYNNRMSDIHAAIGRVQLTRLKKWTIKRRKNASYLSSRIEGVPKPSETPGFEHVYHQYTIRISEDRDGFAHALREQFGVGSAVYYPLPTHRLPSLRQFVDSIDLPNTDRAAAEVLSLPVHPGLSRRQLDVIARAVNKLVKAGS